VRQAHLIGEREPVLAQSAPGVSVEHPDRRMACEASAEEIDERVGAIQRADFASDV